MNDADINQLRQAMDFTSAQFRRQYNTKIEQVGALKAIGLHKQRNLRVIDTCAGLGQDGALMAARGAIVTMLERNSKVYSALKQSLAVVEGQYTWLANIRLIHGDAKDFLVDLEEPDYPDVIYIDPMYPHGAKNPRNKAILRTVRSLVGDDADADQLLLAAWGKAKQRIVVKRPKKAPILANKKPSFQSIGNSTRFDIYLAS